MRILTFLFCLFNVSVLFGQTYNQVAEEIQTKSENIVVVTETDSRLRLFTSNEIRKNTNSSDILFETFQHPSTPVTEFNFDTYLSVYVEKDVSGRWEDLYFYLRDNLTEQKVFEFQNKSRYVVFIVGLYEGRLIGVTFYATRT